MGLTLAYRLKQRYPHLGISVLDKEPQIAQHASGRNSGVLHAGFYYSSDSLKAALCVQGNRALKDFCQKHLIPVNPCGKLVVAQNEQELEVLESLVQRGHQNGCEVQLVTRQEAEHIEPHVKTHKAALWSPQTASVNPIQVCKAFQEKLKDLDVRFLLNTRVYRAEGTTLYTSRGKIKSGFWINAAGLYADKLAHQVGVGLNYTLLPFKGLYLKYKGQSPHLNTHIYPVPHLKQPFLGVHFTKTVQGKLKLGPTAIPALWREHYRGFDNFKWSELREILACEAQLFLKNRFGFRDLAFEEIKKHNKSYFVGLSQSLAQGIKQTDFGSYMRPGIRAQLLDKRNLSLVSDFKVIAHTENVHILNAVSPAFTCSLSFADYVIQEFINV